MNKASTLQSVLEYQPWNNTDGLFKQQTLDFLTRTEPFWQRSTLEGHLTGSAWVVSPNRTQALLIHHAKLDRWFQPGGHAEDFDASLAETARREAMEECGLSVLELLNTAIFDIDVHTIPAKGDMPEHLHYDIRFLFSAPTAHTSFDTTEIKGLKWVDLLDLSAENTPESLRRMALKCR